MHYVLPAGKIGDIFKGKAAFALVLGYKYDCARAVGGRSQRDEAVR